MTDSLNQKSPKAADRPENGNSALIGRAELNRILAAYGQSSVRSATFQLSTTLALFAASWMAMLASLAGPYWITLLLSVPTGLLVVRLFILQHDCGHGSFLPSQRANNIIGSILGLITLMPYLYWRKTHAIHHATSGDLDRRGFGDVTTITVREYLGRNRVARLSYRLYRNPLVLLIVGPLYQFVLKHRFPFDLPFSWKREWGSIIKNNIALAVVLTIVWNTIGIGALLAIQLPVIMVSGALGVYLFYVQHQYEDTYWRFHEAWDYYEAGMLGSSYLAMPRLAHWFTGNIGFHHIHHVNSRIPNYRLPACYSENAELHRVTTFSLMSGLKTLFLTLWDEDSHKLIGFRQLKKLPATRAA